MSGLKIIESILNNEEIKEENRIEEIFYEHNGEDIINTMKKIIEDLERIYDNN